MIPISITGMTSSHAVAPGSRPCDRQHAPDDQSWETRAERVAALLTIGPRDDEARPRRGGNLTLMMKFFFSKAPSARHPLLCVPWTSGPRSCSCGLKPTALLLCIVGCSSMAGPSAAMPTAGSKRKCCSTICVSDAVLRSLRSR